MSAKCVELVAVYDDGTVERYDGPGDGWHLARPYVFSDDATKAYPAPTTVMHPLRKMTRVRGSWRLSEDREHEGIANGNYFDDLASRFIPGELERKGPFDETGEYDFRVTVEAVPVKEGEGR